MLSFKLIIFNIKCNGGNRIINHFTDINIVFAEVIAREMVRILKTPHHVFLLLVTISLVKIADKEIDKKARQT